MNFIPEGSFIRYRTKNIQFAEYDLGQSQGVEKKTIHSYNFKTLKIDPREADIIQTFLFIADESEENRSIYRHEFWVSEVTQTQYQYLKLPGNQIKLSQTTGAGQALGVVGGAALLTILVAAEVSED